MTYFVFLALANVVMIRYLSFAPPDTLEDLSVYSLSQVLLVLMGTVFFLIALWFRPNVPCHKPAFKLAFSIVAIPACFALLAYERSVDGYPIHPFFWGALFGILPVLIPFLTIHTTDAMIRPYKPKSSEPDGSSVTSIRDISGRYFFLYLFAGYLMVPY